MMNALRVQGARSLVVLWLVIAVDAYGAWVRTFACQGSPGSRVIFQLGHFVLVIGSHSFLRLGIYGIKCFVSLRQPPATARVFISDRVCTYT